MSSFSQRLATRVTAVTFISLIALFGLVRLKATAESGSRKEAVVAGRAGAHSESVRAYVRAASSTFSPLAILNVDRFDDPSPAASFSACTAAPSDCSLRGAIIAANLAPGSTINLPAGTYTLTIAGTGENNAATGDLDVRGNNTSIIGAGAGVSIVQQTVADRVFDVNPTLGAGFNFTVSGVTVSGGNLASGSGAGMLMGSPTSTLTLSNCAFSGNSARANGGAISFSVNSVSNLTATDCSFSNNTAVTGVGGAINYNAAGTLLIARTTFSGNAASANSGGALNVTTIAGVGIYNISQTAFVNNSAGGTGRGGAIAKTNGLLNVSYSRLVGNTAAVPANGHSIAILPGSTGSATVDDNWWGLNSGPAANHVVGTTANSWLQLQANASPNTVCANGTSTINADIKKRSSGGPDLTVELTGLPPFPANFVNATPSLGSVSGASANFVDGAASATFTAAATPGTAMVDVIADSQTVTASITIDTNTTSDPADEAVCEGGTATFTTNSSGPGPFSFVWKKGATVLNNGDLGGRVIIVSGPSSSTLTISNVQSSDADTFTVESTGACSTASQSATLTVNSPTTTTDPPDQTVCAGAMANFSTTASGTGPFTYAWTLDGNPYNGNSASISIDTTGMSGNHTVSVTTTGACGSASQSATLTVNSPTTTTDPPDQTVCAGAMANFSTTAGGTGPFHYSWTLDGNPYNGDNASISIDTTGMSGNHSVSVTTTGACGNAVQSATLTVNSPTTTSDPPDQTVCAGAIANFSTTAGGTGPHHYSWTLDGNPYNGDNASISIDTTGMSGNHTVSVTTTGTCGSASQSATLTVNTPTTTSDPADQTVCQGATANFSTTAGGTGPFTYAWTVDGSPAGSNSPNLSVNTGSLSIGSHTVSVTTTGACGSASQSASLTVQANTTATDPADVTVCQGAPASFSTTASGDNVHYAWTLDGSPFNGDSASINVPTGSLSVGSHNVGLTVTGTCGTVSQTASLTVQANTTATDPADATVCQGAPASFSTTASGDNVHYAWTLDGSPFNGDSASINVPTGSLSVGSHNVGLTVTGTCGTVSQTASLTVQANTTTTDPADQTVCQGAMANFSTTANGTGPFHYSWTLDGNPYNGDNASISINTGSLSVGNHSVSVTTSGACGSASQSATLTVQATTTTTDPADQTVCEGATANFSTTAGGTGPFHYAWTLDGNPYNGDSASISVNTTGFSQGAHSVTVTTTGSCGSASQTATLTVNNGTPTLTVAHSSISIWPPNHQYQNFTLTDFGVTANSACDGNLTNSVVIMSVTSDELDDNPGGGDGNTIHDIVIANDCKSVQLRRERDGNLDGRVYTITFLVTDSIGHTATGTAQVTVPPNQSGGSAVNSGPHNTVNGTCP